MECRLKDSISPQLRSSTLCLESIFLVAVHTSVKSASKKHFCVFIPVIILIILIWILKIEGCSFGSSSQPFIGHTGNSPLTRCRTGSTSQTTSRIDRIHHRTFLMSQNPGLASLAAFAFSADVTATTRPAFPLIAAKTSANSLWRKSRCQTLGVPFSPWLTPLRASHLKSFADVARISSLRCCLSSSVTPSRYRLSAEEPLASGSWYESMSPMVPMMA